MSHECFDVSRILGAAVSCRRHVGQPVRADGWRHFKAALINGFVAGNAIANVLDMGCGDGNLLSLLDVPAYVGVDVSATALTGCRARFPRYRFEAFDGLHPADSRRTGAVDRRDLPSGGGRGVRGVHARDVRPGEALSC